MRTFYKNGVRNLYISPGSRSTPLVLAAASHPGFRKKVVLDERSAAFRALGSAKAAGIPALLICTSGTAAANYYPAVIEARHSGVPMILLTADRPPHLRRTGSSQTIDQIKLYGDAVLFFHELGEPVDSEEDYNRLDYLARQAVEESRVTGGPVQINAPFRKPLEPFSGQLEKEAKQNRKQVEQIGRDGTPASPISSKSKTSADAGRTSAAGTVVDTPLVTSGDAVEISVRFGNKLARLINRSERPLIIAGPDELSRSLASTLRQMATELQMPLIAEPGAHLDPQAPVLNHQEIVLRNLEGRCESPDLLITAGDWPTGPAVQKLIREMKNFPKITLHTRQTWQDETGSADYRLILGDGRLKIDGLTVKDRSWLESWNRLDQQAGHWLETNLGNKKSLTDGQIYHHFSKSLFPSWTVMTSNSFTVRDLALFTPSGVPNHRTHVNRGAAGIDGIVSTAIGLCETTEQQTALFIGDLALLHDAGGLAGVNNLASPFLIIAVNNGGGSIFRMLPISGAGDYFTDYFETPQSVDLKSLAAAYGMDYHRIETLDELHQADPNELILKKPLLIECRTDPEASMELRRTLWNPMTDSS